jgi:excisionase family DNA binding protein
MELPIITVTIQDAVKITGLGRTKLYELIGAGRIETRRVGTRRLVDFASLKAFLAGEASR